MLVAELVDNCNLKCVLCWNKNRIPSRKQMSFETVNLILEKYKSKYRIDWFNWGDPLLYKNFFEFSDMIKDSHSKISSSFSYHLTSKHFERLNNFKTIIISISGITEKTYNLYHRGGNFSLVMQNIKRLAETKTTRVILRWLSHPDNQYEQNACRKLSEKFGFQFEPITLNCEVEDSLINFKHRYIKTKLSEKNTNCRIMKWIVIGTDGSYLLCCATHNVKTGYNIKDNVSIQEIIQAKKQIPLCQACRQFEFWKMY